MINVLITGASGCLGSHIVRVMASCPDTFFIFATDKDAERIPDGEKVSKISIERFLNISFSPKLDLLVNCAFSRGNDASALTAALDFNEKVISKAKGLECGAILNISSQGVYRFGSIGKLINEEGEIEPKGMYALAKYAQERMFTSNFGDCVTNIRMASLGQNASFLLRFIELVMQGQEITVTAPHQYVSLVDVRDAANGIVQICLLPNEKRDRVYNLGPGTQYSILQIAEIVNDVGEELGFNRTPISVSDNGASSAVGMDCARLMRDTGWGPKIGIERMIRNIFEKKMEAL